MSAEEKPESRKLRVTRARQRAIGRELRRLYDEVVSEPLPDEFLEILRKIDQNEEKKKN